MLKVPDEEVDKLPVSKSATVNGYTLVTDSPGLPKDAAFGVQTNSHRAAPCSEIPVLNDYKAVEEVKVDAQEKSEEEEEEDEEEDISLDSLLKRSREYVKKEQSQQGSKAVRAMTQSPPPETDSVSEEKSCSPVTDTGIQFGFSLHHSPVGPPQIQHQVLRDPSPQKSICLSPSLPEPFSCLPNPETSISPRPQRRKPRPVSTGNIHFSFPIGPADLIARSPGRSEEAIGVADWGDASMSPSHWSSVGIEGVSQSGIRRSSHCGTSPVKENCNPVSASVPSSMGDHLAAGFRRRCHTMDSQLHTYHCGAERIDRSQERLPRFMAGVTLFAPSRRTPAAPLNQSYDVENPSLPLLRPCVTPADESPGPNNGRKTPTVLRHAAEAQARKTGECL